MREMQTVTDDKVRESLMHGEGNLESMGGWCVFVDQRGMRYYVFDNNSNPVPLRQFLPSLGTDDREDPQRGFVN